MTKKNPAAVALGRLGGRVTSDAKTAAARANGKKGGKPRTAVIHCAACSRGPAEPLPADRVRQGYYGNCAACGRQMRPVSQSPRD
jgi:hypothetical protein